MTGRERARSRILRPELFFILGALVMLIWMSVPSFHAFTTPIAHVAQRDLLTRIDLARWRARHEGRRYVITFLTTTGQVNVTRWAPKPGSARSTPEAIPDLSKPLPKATVVELTTLPNESLVINDTGFPLSSGRIFLRARDGSRDSVVIGGGE